MKGKCVRSFIRISNILLPPTIDLHTSAVVCCDQLPQIKVTRLPHLYSEAFPVVASTRGVMGCLCQQIYLLKFRPLSCDTCSNSNRDVTMAWKRGVSYWMTPPSYIGGKEWGVRTKVVIDWNTLNDVEDPPSRNQFCPFYKAQLPQNQRQRAHTRVWLWDYEEVNEK